MASRQEFGSLRHLAGRFVASLVPVGPSRADEAWARNCLLPGERALWQRMSGADRRHAVGVARKAVADLGGPRGETVVGPEVAAAGLLHDVGKIEAGMGTWARAAVTLVAMAVGRERLVAWSGATIPGSEERPAAKRPASDQLTGELGSASAKGPRRHRLGLYLGHDRVGADLLSGAGSHPFTVAWAGEHHRPPERWSVEHRLAAALKVADDD